MILIALGGNVPGTHGAPLQTMQWAIGEMAKYRIDVNLISPFYCTKAIGQQGQPDYVNAVVTAHTTLSASNTLKNLQLIEKAAGRNSALLRVDGYWGARPLDLDLIDYKGLVSANYPVSSYHRGNICCNSLIRDDLIYPHPRAHLRPFVMRPIVDIAPFWHHPVSGLSALTMWQILHYQAHGQIFRRFS